MLTRSEIDRAYRLLRQCAERGDVEAGKMLGFYKSPACLTSADVDAIRKKVVSKSKKSGNDFHVTIVTDFKTGVTKVIPGRKHKKCSRTVKLSRSGPKT